jgi:pimeloyl-ACP methyl ester carboxylesterase
MTTFAIIPGAGDSPSSWRPVSALLGELGHEVIAVDLPVEDPGAGWADYADAVVAAVSGRRDIVVVAHSLGGFTAPLVCERVPVSRLVLVAAMIPTPGALVGEYWSKAGYHDAQFDEEAFFHDLSAEAREIAKAAERDQPEHVTSEPSPLTRWPNVPTHYLLCRDDRVFAASVSRRIVPERLGILPDEIDGGHCVYLARPRELAARLHRYAIEQG